MGRDEWWVPLIADLATLLPELIIILSINHKVDPLLPFHRLPGCPTARLSPSSVVRECPLNWVDFLVKDHNKPTTLIILINACY